MSDDTNETVEVVVTQREDGVWVALESEYQEEGYVGEWDHRPTAEELRDVCQEYVERR